MSVVSIAKTDLKLKDIVEIEVLKNQVIKVGRVGIIVERNTLEKPIMRLDIYEEDNHQIVGASTFVSVFGKDMEHYHIENKYVRLLASTKLHEGITKALAHYRYQMDEYLLELDANRPANVLKNFCKEAELSITTIIGFTVQKLKDKGLNTQSYTKKQKDVYITELNGLNSELFFKRVGLLLNKTEEEAEDKYAEALLSFWLFHNLNMEPKLIDESFEWEREKASHLIKNHIFFIFELHRAIEKKF